MSAYSVRMGHHFGQFVFPKLVLFEQGILSNKGEGGKRAIRIYPPWDKILNRQAQKTQRWQLEYFLDVPCAKPLDSDRFEALYSFA